MHSTPRFNLTSTFAALGGDGASTPRPKGAKVLKIMSQIFCFRCGLIAEVIVGVMTRARYRRWQAGLREDYPAHLTIDVGPLVILLNIRDIPFDESKWRDELFKNLTVEQLATAIQFETYFKPLINKQAKGGEAC